MPGRTRTLTALIDGARRKSDTQSESYRHPDDELTDYANKGIAFVSRILTMTRGYDHYGRTWFVLSDLAAEGTTPPLVTVDGEPPEETDVVITITNVLIDLGTASTISYAVSIDGGDTIAATGDFECTVGATRAVSWLTVTFPVSFNDGTTEYHTDNVWTATTSYPQTTIGRRWIAAPGDMMHIHSVAIRPTSGGIIKLDPVEQDEEVYLSDDTRAPRSRTPLKYRLRGNTSVGSRLPVTNGRSRLELFPTPQTVVDVIVRYTPHAGTLEEASDSWDGINGHEDAVETWMAREISMKDERDDRVMMFTSMLAKWEAELKAGAIRISGDPARVKARGAALGARMMLPRGRW